MSGAADGGVYHPQGDGASPSSPFTSAVPSLSPSPSSSSSHRPGSSSPRNQLPPLQNAPQPPPTAPPPPYSPSDPFSPHSPAASSPSPPPSSHPSYLLSPEDAAMLAQAAAEAAADYSSNVPPIAEAGEEAAAGEGGEDAAVSVAAEDPSLSSSDLPDPRPTPGAPLPTHFLPLFLACFHVIADLFTVLLSLALLSDYYSYVLPSSSLTPFRLCSLAVLIILGIRGLVQTEFDYFNRGSLLLLPLNLLQLRTCVDFYHYLITWRRHYRARWPCRFFYCEHSFESMHAALPLLIVHCYVIIFDEMNSTGLQIAAFVVTSLCCLLDLLPHFRYLLISTDVYAVVVLKALFNTALRTVLISYLFWQLSTWAWAWIVGSFLLGCLGYFLFLRFSLHHLQRDDPLSFPSCHVVLGGLLASHFLFLAIPFAPSHSIYDFWRGYVVSEIKLQLENYAAAAAVLYLTWQQKRDQGEGDMVYAALAFGLACSAANVWSVFWLNHAVKREMRRRGIYSENSIVRLYATALLYWRRQKEMKGKEGEDKGKAISLEEMERIKDEKEEAYMQQQMEYEEQQRQERAQGLNTEERMKQQQQQFDPAQGASFAAAGGANSHLFADEPDEQVEMGTQGSSDEPAAARPVHPALARFDDPVSENSHNRRVIQTFYDSDQIDHMRRIEE